MLPGLSDCLVFCSDDSIDKLLGELIALIGIGFLNADVNVARRFREDFLIGSVFAEGCGGAVVIPLAVLEFGLPTVIFPLFGFTLRF